MIKEMLHEPRHPCKTVDNSVYHASLEEREQK